MRKYRPVRRLLGPCRATLLRALPMLALLGAEVAAAFVVMATDVRPALAQWSWERPPRPRAPVGQTQQRRRPQQQFTFPFFFDQRPQRRQQRQQPQQQTRRPSYQPWFEPFPPRYSARPPAVESQRRRRSEARAPAPRATEKPAAKTVLVLGDAMADWLGYGLEQAFVNNDELGVERKHRAASTLIYNDNRDYDWLDGVRGAFASSTPAYVVMMIGLSDRHSIRERPPRGSDIPGSTPSPPAPRQPPGALHEFASEKWTELYAKRVDEVIAALKQKGVPVIWVGLPPIRSNRGREELQALNAIFKERAEKADIHYVDVWEGFTSEAGDYAQHGPDVMGQPRRLRANDGVHFTEAGALKLAHYVDREIKRLMSRETPVALPAPGLPPPVEPAPAVVGPGVSPERPLVGAVIPLTGGAAAAEPLLGARQDEVRAGDPSAARVLVKGAAPAAQRGRADDFAWPAQRAAPDPNAVEPLPQRDAVAAVPAPVTPVRQTPRPLPRIGQRAPSSKSKARPAKPAQ